MPVHYQGFILRARPMLGFLLHTRPLSSDPAGPKSGFLIHAP